MLGRSLDLNPIETVVSTGDQVVVGAVPNGIQTLYPV